MFWLRNMKINFKLCNLILRPVNVTAHRIRHLSDMHKDIREMEI